MANFSILKGRPYLSLLLLLALIGISSTRSQAQCGCTFTISLSAGEWQFDGAAKGVKPGDKICFANGTRGAIQIINVHGTAAQPVTICNTCTGSTLINNPSVSNSSIQILASSYFHFTGAANPGVQYGINISGGLMGLDMNGLSTNFEIDHVKVYNVAYGGIIAKTDPTCSPTTWRGNFIMYNTSFHDNDITTIGGEGFYIGDSHYHTTVAKVCSGNTIQVEEHEVIGVEVYNNYVHNTGRDGIQVGSATTNCKIHHNTVINSGLKNDYGHLSGFQINPGTNAELYDNYVSGATGFGVFLGGEGNSRMYNNVIINCLQGGIICQDYPPYNTAGFTIANNTLVNNTDYGIYMFSQNTLNNYFYNNIVVGTTQPSFLYVRLNNPGAIKWTESNNIKTTSVSALKFINPDPLSPSYDFRIQAGSSAIDAGKDLTSIGINFDLNDKTRPKGTAFDIGAYEYQPNGPTSNAGVDKTMTLPTNSVTLNGTGTSATGITAYKWTQKSGGAATLANDLTANLSLTNLVQGIYVFTLQVTDISGTDFDDVTVTVSPAAVNQPPVANATADKTITLPTNSVIINGSGTDADGSVNAYLWTQVSGPSTASLAGATTPNLTASALVQGTYVFNLQVTDNLLATGSDQISVIVNPAGVNQLPVVNAGVQQNIFLPTTTATLTATASDPDGSISTILWTKKSGGAATIVGPSNTLGLSLSGLALGSYTFRITVTDNSGGTNFSEVIINILAANQSPIANAGPDKNLTLPTNSTTLNGGGTDIDGTINGYLWTKVSGPAATLNNQTTQDLSLTGLVQGIYVFGLTVFDNNGASGYDEALVAVSVPPSGPNESPVANAGGNIAFSLPTSSVNLYGSGFDPDGTIANYSWSLSSGGSATLVNANTPTLTVTGLSAGQYVFRLRVQDDDLAFDDDIAVVTVSAAGTNVSPVASAGVDKVVKLPLTSTALNGSATDADGIITSYLWTQVSGAPAAISSPTDPSTTIFGLALGNYQFRLTATDDDGATDFSDIIIRVVASTTNEPPIVDAGPNVKVFLPQTSTVLSGTATDDGTIVSTTWTKLSGPTVTMLNANTLNLTLQNLVQGTYQFQLSATDNLGATVFDIVEVGLYPANFAPPVVDAGPDKEITLPTDNVSLTGTATSSNSTISSTTWTQLSGPTATLNGTNTLTLLCSAMPAGTYIYTLTAKDGNNNQTAANVRVLVNPVPPNQAPVVSAGSNQIIKLPVSDAVLLGSAEDSDGTVASTQWTQVSGPSTVTIQNATSLTATAKNLIAGNYAFKLSATDDKGAVGSSTTTVIVIPPNPGKPSPIVYAGGTVTVVAPQTDTTIVAEATSPNGFIVQYLWKQIAGPKTKFSDQGAPIHLTDLVPGAFAFELTVVDSDTISASDVLTVKVIDKEDEIPKFFSPNNDGYGEYWVFRNVDAYQTCKLMVYSRSGQIVYESAPYKNNWNGTYNGRPLSDGDYYYNIKCESGREINGAVRIIR